MGFQMVWPTQYGLITQQFGERPEVYGKFGLPGHEGIDFQAPNGSEIYAVADGTVSDVRPDGNSNPNAKPYGNQIRIQHAEGYESIYAHLQQILVVLGQTVTAGQLIGLADNTGNSAGAHLHFAVKKKGATAAGATNYPYDLIDPTPYLLPFGVKPGPQPEPPAKATMDVEVISPDVGTLNVRAAPYVGAGVLAQVSSGAKLGALESAEMINRKIGQAEQWLWVRTAEGVVGYVAAWYVRLPGGAAPTPVVISVVAVSPEAPLKVRKGAGTQFDMLAQVNDGAVLTALEPMSAVRQKIGSFNQWLNVKTADGVVGYSAAWYLKLPESASVSFGISSQAVLEDERVLVKPDDFQLIRGMGDRQEALLHRLGIVTFEQLSRMSAADLKAVLAEAGLRGRLTASWPEQARLLCLNPQGVG